VVINELHLTKNEKVYFYKTTFYKLRGQLILWVIFKTLFKKGLADLALYIIFCDKYKKRIITLLNKFKLPIAFAHT